jgi:hypothetical protein
MAFTDTPVTAARAQVEQKTQSRRATLLTGAALLVLVTLIVVLTPVSIDDGDTRLTITPYGQGNARLASELARRLGWRVKTTSGPFAAMLDSTVIYAVFDGPTPLSLAERSALLRAVRQGAGLLVSPAAGSQFALLDSLGLALGPPGLVATKSLGGCPTETDPFNTLRIRPNMVTFDTVTEDDERGRDRLRPRTFPAQSVPLLSSVVTRPRFDDAVADDSTTQKDSAVATASAPDAVGDSATVDSDSNFIAGQSRRLPTVLAFPFGRGRVVAIADPDILRTDQLRDCSRGPALSVVRALEYLSTGRTRALVVAEHLQTVRDDGATKVLSEWLWGSGLGRLTLTLMAASLVWLLARGRRTLAPVYRLREERRSALEHVDALAVAWQAVRGTRTVAKLLARGIRRRHAAGRWRSLDDAAFLAALAERHPTIADDAERLTRAMTSPIPHTQLPALRSAAANIDAECLTP